MTEQIRRLFVLYGTKDYIGEQGISQLEHALQCADAARDASESRSMQLAALCHDVGHLLLLDGHDLEDMNGLGACRHAEAGADWMASLGFGLDVTTPIRHHVDVKRYWACRDATYIQGLSPASCATLRLQGGPMTLEEADAFERLPEFEACCRLRDYDNAAKIPNKPTRTLDEVLDACT